jgi:hypothetical protein
MGPPRIQSTLYVVDVVPLVDREDSSQMPHGCGGRNTPSTHNVDGSFRR